MKKTIIFSLVILWLLFGITMNSLAQWQSDVRLTNDPQISLTSYGNARCVAADGDVVHVVWYSGDTVNVNGWDIFYKRSTDKGLTWSTTVNLNSVVSIAYNPAIAVSGSTVHVTWYDKRSGIFQEIYKRSLDGGLTWENEVQLTSSSVGAYHCSIAASGLNVHLVWYDGRDGNREIYYKNSVDGGSVWSSDVRLTNNTGLSYMPSVAVSGSIVHVAWYDSTAGNWEIYYKRSADGGVTWGADTRLTNNSAVSNNPTLAVSGSTVHIVWTDNRNKTVTLFYKRSTNGGLTWGSDIEIFKKGPNYSRQYPSIAVEGSTVHVAYEQYVIGGPEIFYVSSVNSGATWGSDVRLTNAADYSIVPSIAVSNGNINVLWRDYRDGNWEIYYKRNLNAQANPLDVTKINSETPNVYSLNQNYPNPFNPVTNIRYALPKNGFVKLVVFDALGREVATLVNESLSPGTYEVEFNGSNLSSGIYFYQIKAGDFIATKKLILLK